jgi:hypothetical protein
MGYSARELLYRRTHPSSGTTIKENRDSMTTRRDLVFAPELIVVESTR